MQGIAHGPSSAAPVAHALAQRTLLMVGKRAPYPAPRNARPRQTEDSVHADARLEAAFAALGGEYRVSKEASEKAVCEWQWATFCRFDVRPLHFEQNGIRPGR